LERIFFIPPRNEVVAVVAEGLRYMLSTADVVNKPFCKMYDHIDRDYVVDSVPHCLVELVLMIEHRPDIKSTGQTTPSSIN
jgi:hypothetical protein